MQSSEEKKTLVGAAKVIGKVAGKIAGLAGAKTETQDAQGSDGASLPKRAARSGKLEKKDRPHLPRRQKKAQKKLHA